MTADKVIPARVAIFLDTPTEGEDLEHMVYTPIPKEIALDIDEDDVACVYPYYVSKIGARPTMRYRLVGPGDEAEQPTYKRAK